MLLCLGANAQAANVVMIGDSLTAEYDTIPNLPNFVDFPTDYAKVTVPEWEAMSWTEVVARVQPRHFNLGGYKSLPDLWSVPRMSGYEYNWGIPGATSSQYRDFLQANLSSDPFYFLARQPLEDQLQRTANRVVIWLGGNDFREEYGTISEGGSSNVLIANLVSNLSFIIDYVRLHNPRLQIVLANVPDLGATPTKKAAHRDPAKRARVTAATEAANAQIAALAARKGVPLADAYSLTKKLVNNVPLRLGPVQFVNDRNSDNNPRYIFTREGLHPNTVGQIFNARSIIEAFNRGYNAGIPQITDAQALTFLKIPVWRIAGVGDFNGDGSPDLVWQNSATGHVGPWFMNGLNYTSSALFSVPRVADTNWKIAGLGEFDANGQADLIWQNGATGGIGAWLMNGVTRLSSSTFSVPAVPDTAWKIVASGDFNADGQTDLVWQNQSTGATGVWLMNGVNYVSFAPFSVGGVADVNWKIVAVADFNGDGNPDLLWQNNATGAFGVWFMDGVNYLSAAASPGVTDTNWKIAGVGDFNGDGSPDLVWQNIVTGNIGVWFMNGVSYLSSGSFSIPQVADSNW